MSDWPYAADGVERDEFAESLRLPLTGDPYPGRCYITAVIVSVEPHLWHGVRPTDDELRAVASFHDEYVAYWVPRALEGEDAGEAIRPRLRGERALPD